MEGLIPFVYRAIVEYKNGNKQDLLGSWLNESPSASYMRLPGDSGRFQASDIQLFRADFGLASSPTPSLPSSSAAPTSSQIMVSTGVHSPVRRRVAA